MGTEPVRQRLTESGFGVGIGARAHHRHKDLSLLYRTSRGIGEWHCLSAVVDEQLFTCHMNLAHAAIDAAEEVPVEIAELAVLIAGGVVSLVFVPKKSEGNSLSLHLLLQEGPFRLYPGNLYDD